VRIVSATSAHFTTLPLFILLVLLARYPKVAPVVLSAFLLVFSLGFSSLLLLYENGSFLGLSLSILPLAHKLDYCVLKNEIENFNASFYHLFLWGLWR